MTLDAFNEKYKDVIINGTFLKIVSTDKDLKAIITTLEVNNSILHNEIKILESKIEKNIEIVGDILNLQPVWEIEPTREYLKIEQLEAQGE